MDYLLDTHTCIWAIGKQTKLSLTVKDILQDPENTFWVSKISLLEIAIKLKIGKLQEFKTSLPEFIQSLYLSGYKMLPMKDEHLETYGTIDFDEGHRDPFDRYLLSVAHFENMSIITKDEKFWWYNKIIQIIW